MGHVLQELHKIALGTQVMQLVKMGAAVYGPDSCISVLGYWHVPLRSSAHVCACIGTRMRRAACMGRSGG